MRDGTADGGGAPAPDPDRQAGYLDLLRAVGYREYLLFVRYPADAVGGIVVSLIFFGLLFFGGRAIAGQALTDEIEGIVVGYFLWTLSVGAYSSISNDIGSEVQWGTLERHFMTPFGFAPVAFAKGVAKVVRTFLISVVILAVMLVVTGTTLQLDLLTITVVAVLAVCSVLGLGFAAGGVAVLYKRIGSWLNLLQFGFVVLISAPAFDLGWTRLLPLVQGSALLQRAMIDGLVLWEMPLLDLSVLLGTAVGYVLAGYAVFAITTKRARRLGVLGDY
ncbi:ABC transporter permease [Halapricum sp. CBA1109]|uniref:ABC transporter permease n=1 Tax=Halapricum sp. CBA1109 TaxID=2668068 RepID=UPI0012F97709|nr:ABC transporter permease [Halapricum sp. CBA1109]MUV90589.1 ABC transporter permease [Halapricum sp. CBA1109]